MSDADRGSSSRPALEERKLELDERRFQLENSFARKWLPTVGTIVIGFVATVFGYVQSQNASQATERFRIEAKSKDEHDWAVKVVEMYLTKRDLFDLTTNPEQATANLQVLAAVAPAAVKGLLNAELARIPPPSAESDEGSRLTSLAAVANIQNALSTAVSVPPARPSTMRPADFEVYIQYGEGSREQALKAQNVLQQDGFRAPGIEQVKKAPSRLQVRYYRAEQKAFASNLAVKLGAKLSLSTTPDNAILVTSARELPTGLLELWLPATTAE
jgi:hypothetical protein